VYLFDSDIFSFTLSDPEHYPLLSENLDATDPSERWISIITAQELIAWRYNPLLKVPSQQPPRVLRTPPGLFLVIRRLFDAPVSQRVKFSH